MNNKQIIGNISNSNVDDNNINIQNAKYSIEEVVEMIKKGEVRLSVDTITGLHGSTYVRMPALYDSKEGEWLYTTFTFDNKEYSIATIKVKEINWYHFTQILKMTNLFVLDGDTKYFATRIPFEYKRCYSPFGSGVKRTFIREEALAYLGLSTDGKPIIKQKISLQYSGVATYNININHLIINVNRIMDTLKSLDDKVFMCDVYRILKQLE